VRAEKTPTAGEATSVPQIWIGDTHGRWNELNDNWNAPKLPKMRLK